MKELINIKRTAIFSDNGVFCETEFIEGCRYAYYLYDINNKVIEKQFYLKSNSFEFNINNDSKKISNSVRFFYEIDGERYSHVEKINKSIDVPYTKQIKKSFYENSENYLKIKQKNEALEFIDKNLDVGNNNFVIQKALKLFNYLDKIDMNSFFLKSAYEKNYIEVDDIYKNETAKCCHSFYFSTANFLLFNSIDDIFFIVQLRRSIDAIIIPSQNICISRSLTSIHGVCQNFLVQFRKNIDILSSYLNEKPTFKGILVSNNLPYHYFYDTLSGFVRLCNTNKEIMKQVNSYAYEKESFFDPEKIMNKNSKVICLGKIKKSEIMFSENTFLISSVRNENGRNLSNETNNALIEIVLEKSNSLIANDLFNKDWNKINIWFGILAGKREWVEQIDGYVNVIKKLLLSNQKFNFIFDGMTNDIFSANEKSELHQQIIIDICIRANVSLEQTIILDGCTSSEKIYVASKVDFFVTDGATSSMYVSRFFSKRGICHSLAKSRIIGHIHSNNVYHLNNENVKDLSPQESWINSKYSIDPKYFEEVFFKFIGDINKLKNMN